MSALHLSLAVTPPSKDGGPLSLTLATLLPHIFKASPAAAFSQAPEAGSQAGSQRAPSTVAATLTLYAPFGCSDDLGLLRSLLVGLDLVDNDEIGPKPAPFSLSVAVTCTDPSAANAEASASYVKTVASQLQVFLPAADVSGDAATKSTSLAAAQQTVETHYLSPASPLEPSSQISLRSGTYVPTVATSPERRCQLLSLLPLLDKAEGKGSVVLQAGAVDKFLSLDPVSVQVRRSEAKRREAKRREAKRSEAKVWACEGLGPSEGPG
jgi:hypothetical protein